MMNPTMFRFPIDEIMIPHHTKEPIVMVSLYPYDEDYQKIETDIFELTLHKKNEPYIQWLITVVLLIFSIFTFYAGHEWGISKMEHRAVKANAGDFVKNQNGRKEFRFFP